MTTSPLSVKGEKLRYLTNGAEDEKLITGTDTGDNGIAGEFLKVKGTALYWTDNNGDIRSKVGTDTGENGVAGQSDIKVKADNIRYTDDNGDIRQILFGDFSAVLDTLEFDTTRCSEPFTIHISGDVFAVVYVGTGGTGQLVTFTVSSSGAISNSTIDTLQFAAGGSIAAPHIIAVSGDIYVIAYANGNSYELATVEVDSVGNIGAGPVDTFSASADFPTNPKIINVGADMFAVTYSLDTVGFPFRTVAVDTIGIDTGGNIDAAITDGPFLVEAGVQANTLSKDIINVSGTMYAVVYTGDSNDGFIVTLVIQTDGTIAAALTDALEFESVNMFLPVILNVSGDVYVISYINLGTNQGIAKTLSITSGGSISAVIDTLVWDPAATDLPSFARKASSEFFVGAIQSTDSDGFAHVFTIDDDGNFGAVLDTLEFETSQFGSGNGEASSLVSVGSAGLFAVAYEGPDQDGFVKTFSVS